MKQNRIMHFFVSVLILLLFLASPPSYSQTPYFKKIYLNKENSNLKVTTVFKDEKGLLWFGTSEGLYSFDGVEYYSYSIDIKNFDNTISCIFEDSQNMLWVGLKNGRIAQFKDGSLRLISTKEIFPKRPITGIAEDNQQTIWFSSAGDGVYYLKNNHLLHVAAKDGMNDNYTYCITKSNDGKMWVGTDDGIAVCSLVKDTMNIEHIRMREGLPDKIIRCIVPDMNGDLWIATQDKGVCKYLYMEKRFDIPAEFLNWNYGQINNITKARSGWWISTDDRGIIFYDSNSKPTFKPYKKFSNLSFDRITSTCVDNENNVWLVANNTIYESTGNHLMILDKAQNQNFTFIHTLLCDKKNNLWFTPDQQLIKLNLNDSTYSHLQKINITIPSEMIDIVSLYEDRAGFIWVGTMGRGLFRVNPITGNVQKIYGSSLLTNGSVIALAGYQKNIWVSTLSGVVKITLPNNLNTDFLQPSFENYFGQNLLGNYYIYSIFVDSKKRVWFGTDGKGITCLDNTVFYNYNEKNGIKNNVIYSITEDSKGNIWFSTLNAGIYKYDGKTFRNYSIADGVRNLSISSIISDGRGSIIIMHKQGIDVLDEKTGKFFYFGSEVGLSDVNSDLNSITKDKDGNIWIGTEQGIIKFYNDANHYTIKPRTILNKISLFTDELTITNQPIFRYNQNNLSFDFYSIWYSNPDRIRYQYILQGYTSQWINTKDRKLIFPNLSPGKYVFKVRSSINNNFKNASEASFSFTIKKPIWQQWWAQIIFFIALITAIYFLLRLRLTRVRNLERLEKEKIEFQFETLKNQVNPHFLFNSFNTLISIIDEDKEVAIEYVEKLSDFFRNIVTYRDKNTIPLRKELELASTYFFIQKKRYGKNFSLKIDVNEESMDAQVPPLVLQILLENAVKHNAISAETPLRVSIYAGKEKGRLFVSNKINKKRNPEEGTGTGLPNIVSRYRLLTPAGVTIENTLEEFIVSIPLI